MLGRQPFKRVERRLAGTGAPSTTRQIARRMSLVRRRGTAPELRVRSALSAMGLHYRTQNRDLPGKPDLANRSKKWAVFVHGCFWHQHPGCPKATVPKTNRHFWRAKFSANRRRDARVCAELLALGFSVITVWECETRTRSAIRGAAASLMSD
jgi:DNA mismatch endonuclease, patch repair protein